MFSPSKLLPDLSNIMTLIGSVDLSLTTKVFKKESSQRMRQWAIKCELSKRSFEIDKLFNDFGKNNNS